MAREKEVIGGDLIISGRKLTLSKAIRAGDYIYVTGQVPFEDGKIMTHGTIETQTHAVLQQVQDILADAGCTLSNVIKSMIWLRDKSDFPGFNTVYGEYFPEDPPARSAVISELLVDVKIEIEVIAYDPDK